MLLYKRQMYPNCTYIIRILISIGNGIVRTVEEQQIEAIEILSLAVENAAAKSSKLLGE